MKSKKKIVYTLLNLIIIFFLVICYNPNSCTFQEEYQLKINIQNGDMKSDTHLANSWIINGAYICSADGDQLDHQICNDKMGGAIIVWEDRRELGQDIYAQRINSNGITQWTADGVAICTVDFNRAIVPQICSDGAGGAIIAWQDGRNDWDIYAQKINSTGDVQWKANGVEISTAYGIQTDPQICSDGAGGAIITWQDGRNDWDIYAQKINTSGDVQWTENGVAICTAAEDQWVPQICSDSARGAIIVWQDYRDLITDIFAQKISSSGSPQWTTDGVAICTMNGFQYSPKICNISAGGAIIIWEDERGGTLNRDIYGQKISSSGSIQWTANGVPICTASNSQERPVIYNDKKGGTIVVWEDNRYSNSDIYAQRINPAGIRQWTANGVAICTSLNSQQRPDICCDDTSGAIIAWQDGRNGWDIYAQCVNITGAVQWKANGTEICSADDTQRYPKICSDGANGSIISWQDYRNNWDYNIFAQRIFSNGIISIPIPPHIVYKSDDDNDKDNKKEGKEAIIGYNLSIIATLSFGASIVIIFKIKKNFKNKLRKF